MTDCPICGEPVGTLEAHHIEVTIQPDGTDADVTVHPNCCPADEEYPCDSMFEHTADMAH